MLKAGVKVSATTIATATASAKESTIGWKKAPGRPSITATGTTASSTMKVA